jgi:hypothetical protein
MTPWFTVLIVFLFLIFFVVRMFSGPDDQLFASMIKSGPLKWVLIVLFIVILIISLSSTFGQTMLESSEGTTVSSSNPVGVYSSAPIDASSGTVVVVDETGTIVNNPPRETVQNNNGLSTTASNDFSSNVLATFIHPKILGMILIFVIGFFSILLLTQSSD